MSDKIDRDDVSGTETTGHEWDGIKELDTPLPRWWLYIFYASIVAAVIYWVLMPAWPLANGYTRGLLNWSDRRIVAAEVHALEASRAPMFNRLAQASTADLARDPELQEFARAAGESAFGDNCQTCHGAGGAGSTGYPVLADDVWLWGGSLDEIEHTIRVGIRSGHPDARISQMPAFGRDHMLTVDQIGNVTEYVISMSAARERLQADARVAALGAQIYQEQCAVCHGATGAGDRVVGAPSLLDDVWLYGGSREEIRRQIDLGRNGVMPTWERRFDDGTIRALAYYVHQMGGGEPDVVAPAPAQTAAPAPGIDQGQGSGAGADATP
ncbi:MAG: cytochrome-c oxidase, cbb3-type subunit III [Hyphomonadaceae bacterium]|nr:cytochrome-c oxidase, cbb3-type subunit III [Hyphomonadaceae bacterium]